MILKTKFLYTVILMMLPLLGMSQEMTYDLNEIFNEPNIKQNNISFGLRFDL